MFRPFPQRLWREAMIRRLSFLALLCVLSGLLTACDKCGGFQEIRVPGQPHACRDGAAR
jgi:hypothetical protein